MSDMTRIVARADLLGVHPAVETPCERVALAVTEA
jgi:hypothetical protein